MVEESPNYKYVSLPVEDTFADGIKLKSLSFREFCQFNNIRLGSSAYYNGKIKITKDNMAQYGITNENIKDYLLPNIIFDQTYASKGKDSSTIIKRDAGWVCVDVDCKIPTPEWLKIYPFTVSRSGKRHYYCRIAFGKNIRKICGNKVFQFVMPDGKIGDGDLRADIVERKDGRIYFPQDCSLESLEESCNFMGLTTLVDRMILSATKKKEFEDCLGVSSFESLKQVDECTDDEDKKTTTPLLNKILEIIQPMNQTFEEWSKVMWCLPDTQENFKLFCEWSSINYEGFSETECKAKWDYCRDRCPNGLSVLAKYAKILDVDKFQEIQKQVEDKKSKFVKRLVGCFSSFNCAEVFYNSHKNSYLYCAKTWFELDKYGVWKQCDDEPFKLRLQIQKYLDDLLSKDLIDTIKRTFDQSETKSKSRDFISRDSARDDSKEQVSYLKCVNAAKLKLGDSGFKDKIIRDIRGLYNDDNLYDKLNQNRLLFSFDDCLVDLSTGQRREIRPEDYISMTCGYKYPVGNFEEEKQLIKTTFLTMFEKEDDMKFGLTCMASCLRGENYFEKFINFIGDGRNGKGVFFDTCAKAFGKYWGIMPIEFFYNTSSTDVSKGSAEAMSNMYTRVVYSTEGESSGEGICKLAVSKMKRWTGGDIISARAVYGRKKFDFVPHGTVVFNTNHIPEIPTKSKQENSVKERLLVHKFPFTFTSDEITEDTPKNYKKGNPEIKQRFKKDDKIAHALILLLLETYDKELKGKNQLVLPESVKNATTSFLTKETKEIEEFLSENYTKGSDSDKIQRTELYETFKMECGIQIKAQDFYSHLENVLKYSKVSVKGFPYYKGIKPQNKQESKDEVDSILPI